MTNVGSNVASNFLGLAGHDFTESSPRELLEYMTTELRINYLDYWPVNSAGLAVNEYQRLLAEFGVSVYVVNADPKYGRVGGTDGVDQGRDNVRRSIETAAALDVPFVQIYSATPAVHEPFAAVEILASHVGDLTAEAADAGVILVLENNLDARHEDPGQVNVARSVTSIEALFAIVDSPNLGLTFDPANLYIVGGDVIDAFSRLRRHIPNVHIKDAIAATPEREHLARVGTNAEPLPLLDDGTTGAFIPALVGEGGVPWKSLSTEFAAGAYAGWYTLDPATNSHTVHEWCRLSLPVARAQIERRAAPPDPTSLTIQVGARP